MHSQERDHTIDRRGCPRASQALAPLAALMAGCRQASLIGIARARVAAFLCALVSLAALAGPTIAEVPHRHALAMHGEPSLAAGFPNFPYVNPHAPKGGRLNLGEVGTFDSLNPFIIRGVAPAGLRGLVYESLMARSADEPFTLYGLIAKSIQVSPDRDWIVFHLDPEARFSDGRAITPDDVIFSPDVLRRKGRPYLRSHYNKVASVTQTGPRSIRFDFESKSDREIPLIIALMPILPSHIVEPGTFDQTSLAPPIGSGPYLVDKIEPGSRLVYKRDRDYWALDHPVRRGQHNFDTLEVTFYRDATAMFEAFKTGAVHVRCETDPGRWIESYDFPAIREGRVWKKALEVGKPAGMAGLIFNTRRPKFADPRVRRALILMFDGPAINRTLYHGRFVRSHSFFARSSLSSFKRPATELERRLLAPYPDAVLPKLFDGTWRLPAPADQSARREILRQALGLMRDAGYRLERRQLVSSKTGRPFEIEFLVSTNAQERLVLTYARTLARLGIKADIRKVEASQFWARIGQFEFDMIQWHYSASLSPGNEQINRWASSHANIKRSLNYAGARNPAVDAMIDKMLEASERPAFEAAVRAFDRTLLSGHYLIPLFHPPA